MTVAPAPDPPLFPGELVARAGEREETARHAGHADILREQLDGTTGT